MREPKKYDIMVMHKIGDIFTETRVYAGGVTAADYDKLRARLAEVEARLIEHANNSANAVTELLDVKGRLAEVEAKIHETKSILTLAYDGAGNWHIPTLKDAANKIREALAKQEEKKS